MKVFGVNGKGTVGKDALENFVKEYCNSLKIKSNKISMIDMVKDIATSIGWAGGKDMRDRLFLSRLKDLFSEYNDSPYQVVKTRIKDLDAEGSTDVLLIDAREPSDIERLVKDFNAKTILVKRDDTPAHYGNHADDGVFDYQYDIMIDNNGTLNELKDKAIKFTDEYVRGVR